MCPDLLSCRLGHVDHPQPNRGDDPTRKRGDMTAVIMEGGAAAGRTPQAPDIPDLTLPEFVLGAAYQHGGKRALVDAATGHELSYAELADAVREVRAGLSAHGIRPGDVLALCTPNCLEFAVTWFAATSAGAIVTTVNPLCTEEEISRQLRQTGARWLVATAGLIEQKLSAVVSGTAIAETFVIGEGVAGTTPFGSLRATADAPAVPVAASDVALLPTSSGTTGLPKSVELTHRNLVASLCQTSLVHQVTEDDVVIAAAPTSRAPARGGSAAG
jgi:acyl-CoA synthetase (AMP-forming)/AMP-acid ligase II